MGLSRPYLPVLHGSPPLWPKPYSSQWEVSKDDDYDCTGFLNPPAMDWPEADVTRKPALAFGHLS